jgi:hypothetical protein
VEIRQRLDLTTALIFLEMSWIYRSIRYERERFLKRKTFLAAEISE